MLSVTGSAGDSGRKSPYDPGCMVLRRMGVMRMRVCLVAGFVSLLGLSSCAREQIEQREDHLAAAGFAFRPADTAERQAMLSRLPAHRFVRRMHAGQVFYVYSDPTVCGCLYVGDEGAWSRYQQYRQAQALADEQQMTAMEYNDASWNWGAWGPWGGPGWGGWNPAWNPAWGNWDPGMGQYNYGW